MVHKQILLSMQLVAKSEQFYQSRSITSESTEKLFTILQFLISKGYQIYNFLSCPPDAISVESLFHFEAINMLFDLKIVFNSPLSFQTLAKPSEALVTTLSPVC